MSNNFCFQLLKSNCLLKHRPLCSAVFFDQWNKWHKPKYKKEANESGKFQHLKHHKGFNWTFFFFLNDLKMIDEVILLTRCVLLIYNKLLSLPFASTAWFSLPTDLHAIFVSQFRCNSSWPLTRKCSALILFSLAAVWGTYTNMRYSCFISFLPWAKTMFISRLTVPRDQLGTKLELNKRICLLSYLMFLFVLSKHTAGFSLVSLVAWVSVELL